MKISICCLTYNHGRFLEEAINSFLIQEGSFELEIVIGDDASTDDTCHLVESFKKQHCNIRYYRHPKNMGMMANAIFTLNQCTGDYIALCEGDDYWTDPFKLQKQLNFLEANSEFSLCVTGCVDRNEANNKDEVHVPGPVITIEDLLKCNMFRTATAFFAAKYLQPVPEWYMDLPFGDWAIYLTVLFRSGKKAGCLNDVTTVRRLHSGGSYSSMYQSNDKVIQTLKWDVTFYQMMQLHLFEGAFKEIINALIDDKNAIIAYLSNSGENENALLNDILNLVPNSAAFILVDEWCLNITGEVDGKRIVPFTEKDGIYWGKPADDVAAIEEIDRQAKAGLSHLFITWQAFWWLDHYAGMYRFLQDNYECVMNNGALIGFDLQTKKERSIPTMSQQQGEIRLAAQLV